jgi:hypothetical protein
MGQEEQEGIKNVFLQNNNVKYLPSASSQFSLSALPYQIEISCVIYMVETATQCSILSITLQTFQPSGRKRFSSSYRRYQLRNCSKSMVSWQWDSFGS